MSQWEVRVDVTVGGGTDGLTELMASTLVARAQQSSP